MAKPRVFISSTYYDLRAIRSDLEKFIIEIGYEPVLFEHAHIHYMRTEALENSCYREIHSCDIVIVILGGRYGSISQDKSNSITHNEINTALKEGKQIYLFVDKAVHSEYRTYLLNKENQSFTPASVDNIKIFEILEDYYQLLAGNSVEPFEVSFDIIQFLKEQWAGLFQRLLAQINRETEVQLINKLESTAKTMDQFVDALKNQTQKDVTDAIDRYQLLNHPAFNRLKTLLNIPYRVIFLDLDELDKLLKPRGYYKKDSVFFKNAKDYYWYNSNNEKILTVSHTIFEDENGQMTLLNIQTQDWKDSFIKFLGPNSPEAKNFIESIKTNKNDDTIDDL